MKSLIRKLLHTYWAIDNKRLNLLGKMPKHIIICGYPRSGTSLIFNMISSFIVNFRCESFEREASQRLHRSGSYVTKFPLDILNIEKIHTNNILNKELFFIVITRDIRDIITSRHPNNPSEYFIGYKNSWWPQDNYFNDWKYNAPGIEEIYLAMLDASKNKNINVLKIRYEDLICDAEKIQIKIEDFVGIKFTGNFIDFHKWKSKHAYNYTGRYQAKDKTLVRENEQIDNTRISKWKKQEHLKIIYEQFNNHPELFDILINEGYESNNHWFNEIKMSLISSSKSDNA